MESFYVPGVEKIAASVRQTVGNDLPEAVSR
jgi:hypothetical protein